MSARLAHPTAWAPAGHEVAFGQHSLAVARPASGTALRPRFDPVTGALVGLGDVEVGAWRLELWRAPIDNDFGAAWDEASRPAFVERWAALGLDRLVSRLVRFEESGDETLVVTRVGGAGRDELVEVSCRWTVLGDAVELDASLVPLVDHAVSPQWWARAGFSFTLDGAFAGMRWFGRGPGQAYPDTGQGTRIGWFAAAVADLPVPHVRPQESGARRDVTEVAFTDGTTRLEISGGPVAVTARPWSTEAVAAASHQDSYNFV